MFNGYQRVHEPAPEQDSSDESNIGLTAAWRAGHPAETPQYGTPEWVEAMIEAAKQDMLVLLQRMFAEQRDELNNALALHLKLINDGLRNATPTGFEQLQTAAESLAHDAATRSMSGHNLLYIYTAFERHLQQIVDQFASASARPSALQVAAFHEHWQQVQQWLHQASTQQQSLNARSVEAPHADSQISRLLDQASDLLDEESTAE